jgi:hypothetical protein
MAACYAILALMDLAGRNCDAMSISSPGPLDADGTDEKNTPGA